MRRHIRRIAACLVVGVVVNVLVAWGAALTQWRSRLIPLAARVSGASEQVPWLENVPTDWPAMGLTGDNWSTTTFEYISQWHAPDWQREFFDMARIRVGWPIRSFAWVRMSRSGHLGDGWKPSDQVEIQLGVVHEGLRWPKDWTLKGDPMAEERRLPLRPVWPGFALNTLVYGAVAWGVLFAPGVVRRWRRRRRGACVGCGYELAGLVRCPECGDEKKRGVKAEALTVDAKPSATLPRGE